MDKYYRTSAAIPPAPADASFADCTPITTIAHSNADTSIARMGNINSPTASTSTPAGYTTRLKSHSAPITACDATNNVCVDCGSCNFQREGRCMTCRDCGWSKCAR